jgi:multidrug efflux pump subunit AcrB
MSEKKSKIMSLSVEPEMQDLLKSSAKKMGYSVSELVRNLVTKYLDLVVNTGEEIPVILQVPANLREDPEGLKKWLTVRTEGIVKALSN